LGLVIVIFPAPNVSNPTPTPSIERSKTNKNVLRNCFGSAVLVLTKAQLFRDAYRNFYSVNFVPIAQSPRPGGRNFKLNILSYIYYA